MRFQDASPDARAVVYAGIQADPLVARAAELLADAGLDQRVLARAVMNGESTDAEAWRAMFPTLFGARRRAPTRRAIVGGDPRGVARRRRARRAGPQPVPRRDRRGADGAAPRARPRGAAPAAVRRERRILFDGVRAEIHPYDVTVERDGAAEAIDCKWGARGIYADVLHQLDDARQHAARRRRAARRRAGRLRCRAGRATSGSTARRRRTTQTRIVGARGP